jgi:hypothetical protein
MQPASSETKVSSAGALIVPHMRSSVRDRSCLLHTGAGHICGPVVGEADEMRSMAAVVGEADEMRSMAVS